MSFLLVLKIFNFQDLAQILLSKFVQTCTKSECNYKVPIEGKYIEESNGPKV